MNICKLHLHIFGLCIRASHLLSVNQCSWLNMSCQSLDNNLTITALHTSMERHHVPLCTFTNSSIFAFFSVKSRDPKNVKGIVPSITYCIAIWGSCSPSTFKVLEHLHLKAAKLIHKLSSETPDSDVLDLVKWKPLGYIYKRRLASIMYQVFHNSLPDQLTALFETRNTDNNYNLRRINDFSHVRYNCNLGRNSVRYRGPIVWNLIH